MIQIEQATCTEALKGSMQEHFRQHAAIVGYDYKREEIAFLAMDNQVCVGAVVGESILGALHIQYLFVEEQYRGSGLGTKLMNKAIAYSSEKQYPFIFLSTIYPEALNFYKKMGFVIEFSRSGHSHKASLYYLRKDL
jgi:ribosomal protein S18 acetylase RimI-like enzyme